MERHDYIEQIKTALDGQCFGEAARLAGLARAAGHADVAARAEAAVEAHRPRERASVRLALDLPEGLYLVDGQSLRVERQSPTAKFAPGELVLERFDGDRFRGVAFVKDGAIIVWTKARADSSLQNALDILAANPSACAKAHAKSKATETVRELAEREASRAGDGRPSSYLVLTDERREAIRAAIRSLASDCDYARERDGIGFNKPDTHLGHQLAASELEDDETLIVAWDVVSRYPRQVKGRWPCLWSKE